MLRSRRPASFLFALLLLIPLQAQAEERFNYPEGRHGNGEMRYRNGLPVLTVEGTPEEIGEQIAALAVKPARRLMGYPRDILKEYWSSTAWRAFLNVGRKMLPQFPADHRREFDALIKGGVDADALLAANTLFDIKRVFACSTLIVEPGRSATGTPLFGRNLDFPTLGYLQDYSLVTIYRSRGKHSFASVGFPGLVGCLSGMNDAGLCLAVLEVYSSKDDSPRFDGTGTPYALCYRRILEECSTIAEAEALLRSMKRTTRTNLAICDRRGGAVFEVTSSSLVVRRATDGFCPCTNHFCTKELATLLDGKPREACDRFELLERCGRAKKIFGLDDLVDCLDAVNQGDHTLQTMIFEPASLRLHLAIGSCPSSALKMKTLDLAPLLAKPKQP
jgi:hypothetical protein